ncbi:MAG: hypothetical protein SFV32_11295 [Opitutaceae bacterium]|nr:hypothetical protein [Opitutaceae bacterium]
MPVFCPQRLMAVAFVTAGIARAAYAPIPDLERGKLLTTYLAVGAYHDTNIFGAPSEEAESWVMQVTPSLAFNYNPDKQTLLAAGYRVEWSHFTDRPGRRDLFSHQVTARAARTFSPRLDADFNALYGLVRNPESLLPGLQVFARDQSRRDTVSDGRVRFVATPRFSLTARAKYARFAYDQEGLATDLDRTEYLTGLAASYLARPRLQAIAEHRGQWVRYRVGGDFKDKDAHSLLGGFDYAIARRFGLTTRAGAEWRTRDEGTELRPYGEVGVRWDYAKESFISTGYAYVVDEVSNLERYADATLHRFFINAQHALTARLYLTGAIQVEPTKLNGRRGLTDVDETNQRMGVALVFKFTKRWDARLTFDRDDVDSDDATRNLRRTRSGIATRYSF